MTDQTSTAVATRRPPSPVAVLLTSVQQREHEFARALPPHVPAPKFVRALQTAITSTPDIAKCTERSVITECMKAAADGLVIDNREATLVKFGEVAKYIPMYQGLMKMARNSGEISTIAAIIVHKGDEFKYTPGLDDFPIHNIDWFGDRGEPVGAYSVVKLKDGCYIVEVMSKAQIMKIAAGTKNAGQYDCTKGASWAEWWRKTLIRRISKYMPRSTDRENGDFFEAVERDDDLYDAETGEVETPKPARKRRGAGAAAMAAQPVEVPEPIAPHTPLTDEPDMPDFLRRTGETPVTDQDEQDDNEPDDAV